MGARAGPRRYVSATVASLVVIAVVAAACSTAPRRGFQPPVPLSSAPEPAVSPPLARSPAGRLVPVGAEPEGIAVSPLTSVAAVAVRGAIPGIDLLDATTGRQQSFVALGGAARHLDLAGPGGPLLVPAESTDRLYVVALPSGRLLASAPVGRQPHDAAAIGPVVLVGDELANTAHIIEGGQVTAVIPVPLQPGGVAAVDGAFVVVGVRARVVAAYRPDGSFIAEAAAGAGPTHVVAGANGYFYVADTSGGALLVYRLAGAQLRQVGTVNLGRSSRPYGLAADPRTGWVFVTLTGTNQLVGMRLDGARIIKRSLWATGRQPNSVAVDTPAASVMVTDTASDQVELIPLPEGN